MCVLQIAQECGNHGSIGVDLVAMCVNVSLLLQIAQECGSHGSIGVDLVAMCVNDVLAHAAEPLFFLDYFACGRLDVTVARDVIAGIASGCQMAGCALIGQYNLTSKAQKVADDNFKQKYLHN